VCSCALCFINRLWIYNRLCSFYILLGRTRLVRWLDDDRRVFIYRRTHISVCIIDVHICNELRTSVLFFCFARPDAPLSLARWLPSRIHIYTHTHMYMLQKCTYLSIFGVTGLPDLTVCEYITASIIIFVLDGACLFRWQDDDRRVFIYRRTHISVCIIDVHTCNELPCCSFVLLGRTRFFRWQDDYRGRESCARLRELHLSGLKGGRW